MAPAAAVDLTAVIKRLGEIFEDDHVNVEEAMDVMKAYKSNPDDWKRYAKFDPYKYTRNLVDKGNGKYNLMVVAWREGTRSPIHDHSDCHCFVKVLDGKLEEVLYDWPKTERDLMPVRKVLVHDVDEVTYMSDSLGLHRMGNASQTDCAVTLHLYIPAFDECCVFDERTGHKSKCKVTFWSKYGEKVEHKIGDKAA